MHKPATEFLRRRNALWAELRALPVGSAAFEEVLTQLQVLIHWPRERILAGLGLPVDEPPSP